MKTCFITGTDTDVGKTLTAAALLLATRGHYWKPIQSGMPDDVTVKQLTGLPAHHFSPAAYTLQASLAPDQAAKLEGLTIDLTQCRLPSVSASPLIIEGAGGILTPLNTEACMADLVQQLNVPVIIVARGTLGTINHTLLTIESLRQRHMPIHGVIFSGALRHENQDAIEQRGQVRTLLHIPHLASVTPVHFQTWVSQHQARIQEVLQ